MPADQRTILKALKRCVGSWSNKCFEDCPYFRECAIDPIFPVLQDTLKLLKEQEPVEPIPPTDESDLWRCGNCNFQLFRAAHENYCPNCGRKVGESGMPDIRDIDGLWCDDITFCPKQCGMKSCPRNSENIRDKSVWHSYFIELPPDCPKQQEKTKSME